MHPRHVPRPTRLLSSPSSSWSHLTPASGSTLAAKFSKVDSLTFSTLLPTQLLQEMQWKLGSLLARSCNRAIAGNFPSRSLPTWHSPDKLANPPCMQHSCSQRSIVRQASVDDSLCFPRDSADRSCRKLSRLGILSSRLATLRWCPHLIWRTSSVSQGKGAQRERMKLYKMRFCFHNYRTLGHRLATASDSNVDSILHHFEKRCGNSSPHGPLWCWFWSASQNYFAPGGVGGAGVVGEADGRVDGSSKLLRVTVNHAWTLSDEFVDLVGIAGAGLDVPHKQSCDRHHLLWSQILSLIFREPSRQLETPRREPIWR